MSLLRSDKGMFYLLTYLQVLDILTKTWHVGHWLMAQEVAAACCHVFRGQWESAVRQWTRLAEDQGAGKAGLFPGESSLPGRWLKLRSTLAGECDLPRPPVPSGMGPNWTQRPEVMEPALQC